jgi:uncharacterized membrane protein YcaP (DUF421 family)
VDILFQIDWKSVFVPSVGILEIIFRGTFIYLALFMILRVLRREAGSLGITDVLVIVLIADAAQNGMAAEYKSVTEALILVATICFWDYLLDWLGHEIPVFQRLIHPAPLLLIKDGRMLRKNMRQEMITQDELISLIRQQGVESADEVKECYLESDGGISVIKKDSGDNSSQGPRKKKERI